MQITTIGVDLAKNVFQVHCVDAVGKVIIARQLRRGRVIVFFRSSPVYLGAIVSSRKPPTKECEHANVVRATYRHSSWSCPSIHCMRGLPSLRMTLF